MPFNLTFEEATKFQQNPLEFSFEQATRYQQNPLSFSFEEAIEHQPDIEYARGIPGSLDRERFRKEQYGPGSGPSIYHDIRDATAQASLSFYSAAIRPFDTTLSDELNNIARGISEVAAEESADSSLATPRRWFRGGVRSLTTAVPAGMLGGPLAIIPLFAVMEGNEGITEARRAGLSEADVRVYAAKQAAIEGSITGAFQLVGLGGFESAIAGKEVLKGGLKAAIGQGVKHVSSELLEENIIEALHAQVESESINPNAADWTNPDGKIVSDDGTLSPMLQRLVDTTGQVFVTMGMVEPVRIAGSISGPQQQALAPQEADQAFQQPLEVPESQIPSEAVTEAPVAFEEGLGPETVQKLKDAGFSDSYISMLGGNENAAQNALELQVPRKTFGPETVGAAERTESIIPEDIGRPDLANPAITQGGRLVVAETDEALKAQQQVRPDVVVQAEASQRIAADYKGERSRLLEAGENDQILTDTSTVIAKDIVNREATKAFETDAEEDILKAKEVIEAYRDTGTAWGRAGRQRRDPIEGPDERMGVLREAIFDGGEKHQGESQAVKDRIKQAKETGSEADLAQAKAELNEVRKRWVAEFKRLKAALKEMGYDVDNLSDVAKDPVKAQQMMNQIEALSGGFSAVLKEYWKNSILSALTTTGADVISSVAFGAYTTLAERAVESAQTSIRRARGKEKRSDAADWGEFKEIFGSVPSAWTQALANSTLAWKTEKPVLQRKISEEGITGKFGNLRTAISGRKGRIIRALGYRRLLFADEFFQTFIGTMEAGAQARRILLAKGTKSGSQEMRQGIDAMVADYQSAAWQQAIKEARRVTFQNESTTIAAKGFKSFAKAAQKFPGIGGYVVPFYRTPINILEAGFQQSPVGLIGLLQKWNHARKTGDWSGVTKKQAQQMIVWSVALAILASNDEEDPWITGSIGDDNFKKLKQARRSIPPQSVRFFGTWYSYARIEPFATAAALTVDVTNAMRSGEPDRVIGDLPESTLNIITNKSYLKQLGDMHWIFKSESKMEGVAKWGSNFGASWIPNIIRHAGKNVSDEFPERGVWGARGSERFLRLGKRTLQKTELPFMPGDEPAYDVWGRKSPRSKSPVPNTDWVFRMLVPTHAKVEDVFIGDRVLMRWNMRNPDDEYLPGAPSKYYTLDGKRHYLTDKEYAQLAKLAGEEARRLVETRELNDESPTQADIDKIKRDFAQARKYAVLRLKPDWISARESGD